MIFLWGASEGAPRICGGTCLPQAPLATPMNAPPSLLRKKSRYVKSRLSVLYTHMNCIVLLKVHVFIFRMKYKINGIMIRHASSSIFMSLHFKLINIILGSLSFFLALLSFSKYMYVVFYACV